MPTVDPKTLSSSQLDDCLLSAVAPRPIALASTVDANGKVNLSPFSYFNVVSTNPPILIFSPTRRIRDNAIKHTLKNVLEVKEVVINIVTFDMVYQMSLTSSDYAEGVNEFEKAGFTMLKSDTVKPYRVGESPIQMECKVNDVVALGTHPGAGNIVICEVVKLHIDDDILNEDQTINQQKLDLVARAGGSYYTRANKGFFKIPRPFKSVSFGIDNFPEAVKNSMVLTGNDLGLLATVEALPEKSEVDYFINELSEKYPSIKTNNEREKQQLARNYLSFGDVDSAWKILLS